MKDLTLFRLDRRGHRLMLASWHSPHSVTWRWLIDISVGGYLRPRFHNSKHNCGGQGWVRLLAVQLSWHWQKPMRFRDLYVKLSDEDWQRRGMMWLPDNHPHKIPDPPPPIPRPTAPASSTIQ